MIKSYEHKNLKKEDVDEFNDKCEECFKKDKSVRENFILTSYKICNSCKISKTIFPV